MDDLVEKKDRWMTRQMDDLFKKKDRWMIYLKTRYICGLFEKHDMCDLFEKHIVISSKLRYDQFMYFHLVNMQLLYRFA